MDCHDVTRAPDLGDVDTWIECRSFDAAIEQPAV